MGGGVQEEEKVVWVNAWVIGQTYEQLLMHVTKQRKEILRMNVNAV
jgi:hypothetical protein